MYITECPCERIRRIVAVCSILYSRGLIELHGLDSGKIRVIPEIRGYTVLKRYFHLTNYFASSVSGNSWTQTLVFVKLFSICQIQPPSNLRENEGCGKSATIINL